MEINPRDLRGNWKAGWALDLHTVSSRALADGIFDTEYTEIGQALYLLKYRFHRKSIKPLVQAAVSFIEAKPELHDLDAIIPVPPSDENRPFQPVQRLAGGIAKKLDLAVSLGYLMKLRDTRPLKYLRDAQSRKEELETAFMVKDMRFAGKDVLLFDDLFRSGETLREITHVLQTQGKVANVFVLTLTKTRTKR
jgi:competence protein ComFC